MQNLMVLFHRDHVIVFAIPTHDHNAGNLELDPQRLPSGGGEPPTAAVSPAGLLQPKKETAKIITIQSVFPLRTSLYDDHSGLLAIIQFIFTDGRFSRLEIFFILPYPLGVCSEMLVVKF